MDTNFHCNVVPSGSKVSTRVAFQGELKEADIISAAAAATGLNRNAIQVGLTATPRHIRVKQTEDEETKKGVEEDKRKLADNYSYFGEPPYEYSYMQGVEDGYPAPAEIEQYDIYHDDKTQSERVRGVYRADVQDKQLTNALTVRWKRDSLCQNG